MSKILSTDEKGNVLLSEQATRIPEFKVLKAMDHTTGKKYYERMLMIIFYCYDRDSVYTNLNKARQIAEAHRDLFQDVTQEELYAIISKPEMQSAINKLNLLQYTLSERHLKQCEEKFEQFQALYSETPVNSENFELIARELKGTNSLFDVIEKLRDKVIKENKQQGVGDYEPTMFENAQ